MNYKIPQPENGVSELREPAVAYCPGVRAAEPWMASIADELDDEPLTAPDGEDWLDWRMKNVPGFKKAFFSWLEEGNDENVDEDQLRTTDEVCDKLLWRIENNQWDDVIEIEAMNQYGKI